MRKINTVGIVAEYNPFHNGHKYQIEKAKEKSGAKNVVAVMSGTVVQRGDFAIFDKWARAKAAVLGGVNLVIELPCTVSGQTAEVFANGAVSLLNSLGVVDGISFGAENESLDLILKAAKALISEPYGLKASLDKYLSEGIGFPKARANALNDIFGITLTDTPNNILAVEYAKAIIKNNYNMEMIPVLRKGSSHDGAGSASYIRGLIEGGKDYKDLVPNMIDEKAVFLKDFSDMLLYRLRTITRDELSQIADVTEGLENRIISCAAAAKDVSELISLAGTKRYSTARLRRILINALLGITKNDINNKPSYIRVLAADESGTALLKEIKKRSHLPVITKLADGEITNDLKKEILATSVYSLALGVSGNMEYKKSPVIL